MPAGQALAVALFLAGPAPAGAAGRSYVVDSTASALTIRVGRAGLFGFAGHEHEVVAPRLEGTVLADPEDLSRSSVALRFEAAALTVTGKGEPADDVPKVQARMVGPELLDVTRFPAITFQSRKVSGRLVAPGRYELQVTGDLALHGTTRSVTLALRVELSGDDLTASGELSLRHTDFDMKPVSVAGVVKVRNEIEVDYRIVARLAAPQRQKGSAGHETP